MINELMKQCGLGEVTGEIKAVSGGFLHKMYRVETETGIYAVKRLNSEIMKRPDARDNYARAERLEAILEKNDLPIAAALSINGKKMQKLGGECFYIFRWLEGCITDMGNVTREQCRIAGELLGRIHSIDIRTGEAPENEQSEVDIRYYLVKAQKHGEKEIAAVLGENTEILEKAQDEFNKATKRLPPVKCITNDDMDPKNVMWHKGEPHIIDLECLEYGSPFASCITLSLQWAGTTEERFDEDDLRAFFEGYMKEFDCRGVAFDKLFGIAYSWLGWLEYNLRRALGFEGDDEAERDIGRNEVRNTIRRIAYLNSLQDRICSALRDIEKG